nr:retrovirus-related Pol polyprotein from transposon TNT 1-94 [Tanacetum cinerariifolium]
MPPKPDLVFHDAPTASETVRNVFNVEPSTTKPTKDMSQSDRPSAPIIEEWVFDSEDEFKVEHTKQAENLKINNHKSRGHKHSWNRKACSVCKSLNHLIKDYDFYEKQMVQKPMWNHVMRVNHHNSTRLTHPHSNRHVVPTVVLTRSRLIPLTAARRVTTAVPQTTVKNQRPVKHVVNKAHSPIRRPINHRPTPKNANFYQKVTTVKVKKVNVVHGKFDGKVDEGFLVGYSVNSKAFKVFNSRTRILQETLHINFLENQPNVARSGPKWLFDIDTLTQSMNYQAAVAGNQPNHSAGIKENLDADPQNTDADATFDVKENENAVHVSLRVRDLRDEFEEFSVNSTNMVNASSAHVTTVGPNPTNSTNSVNAASPSDNVVSPHFKVGDDEEDVGAEADFSNLETNISVSPILTNRVHKDHHIT